ncbi:MAG: HYExAFE family protein, partial [Planctomycetaceae bacterium]|nr:HYExAFE family protein [Planctomycetaceae bacterium]
MNRAFSGNRREDGGWRIEDRRRFAILDLQSSILTANGEFALLDMKRNWEPRTVKTNSRGTEMANRANHYDAAFEEFLRHRRVPYVAVDETRRSLLNEVSLKSPDFIVSPPRGDNWLIDIKGRKFPSGGDKQSHLWENWATRDDIDSMLRWQDVFGAGFRSVLVFSYQILDARWHCQFDLAS